MWCVASHIDVVAIQSIEEVFKSNDAFYILELTDNALDLVAINR